jgi:cytidylate kinase
VFISAPTADRIARLKALHGITDRQAEALIEKTDRQRSAYYNYYSYKTWGAASTYQLCVDSSVLGIDATVAFIRSFVEQRLGEEG